MTYAISWQVLDSAGDDGEPDHGYLRSFDDREAAEDYAREYARAVAATRGDAGTVSHVRSPNGDYVLFATQADGYRESVRVSDRDA